MKLLLARLFHKVVEFSLYASQADFVCVPPIVISLVNELQRYELIEDADESVSRDVADLLNCFEWCRRHEH